MNPCGGRWLRLCILLTGAYLFLPAMASSSLTCKTAHPAARPPVFDPFEFDTRPERFSIDSADASDSLNPRALVHRGWARDGSKGVGSSANTGLETWGDLPYLNMARVRLDDTSNGETNTHSAQAIREFMELLENRYLGSDEQMNFVLGRDSVYRSYDQNVDWKNHVPRFQQQDKETRGQVLVFGFPPSTQRLLEIGGAQSHLSPSESALMKKFGWHSANEFAATAQISYSIDPAHLLNVEKEFPDNLSLNRQKNQVWVESGRGFNVSFADLEPETQNMIRNQGGTDLVSKLILFQQFFVTDYDFGADFMVAEVNDARLRQLQLQLQMKPRVLVSRDTGVKDKRERPIFDHVIIFDQRELHAITKSFLVDFLLYKAEASMKKGRGILWPVSKPYLGYLQELGIFSFLQSHGYNIDPLKTEKTISGARIPIPKTLVPDLIQLLKTQKENLKAEKGLSQK